MGESLPLHLAHQCIYLSSVLVLKNHSTNNFMCQIDTTRGKMSPNNDQDPHHSQQSFEEFTNGTHQIKYLVDLYTATLHLR